MVALGAAACDAGGPEPSPPGPPLRVVAIEATTVAIDADGAPIEGRFARRVLDGSARPIPTTAFHVRVDRYLDPATANRQAVCLQSRAVEVTTLEDCTSGILLRPTYDPVTRTVTYHQETATTQLAPDTFYRLTVLTAREDAGDFGLRAFDGAPLEGNYVLDFATDRARDGMVTESPPEGALFCATPGCLATCAALPPATDADGTVETPEDLAARRDACAAACTIARGPLASCAAGGCHAPAREVDPAMRLDLATADAIRATAVGRVAHQTQRGPQATTGDQSSQTFGRSMPIVAPGDPGRSYLLYKILASPSFAADPTLAEGETERLRASVVVGMPMPPRPFTVPSATQLDDLVAWIAAGATTDTCP